MWPHLLVAIQRLGPRFGLAGLQPLYVTFALECQGEVRAMKKGDVRTSSG